MGARPAATATVANKAAPAISPRARRPAEIAGEPEHHAAQLAVVGQHQHQRHECAAGTRDHDAGEQHAHRGAAARQRQHEQRREHRAARRPNSARTTAIRRRSSAQQAPRPPSRRRRRAHRNRRADCETAPAAARRPARAVRRSRRPTADAARAARARPCGRVPRVSPSSAANPARMPMSVEPATSPRAAMPAASAIRKAKRRVVGRARSHGALSDKTSDMRCLVRPPVTR